MVSTPVASEQIEDLHMLSNAVATNDLRPVAWPVTFHMMQAWRQELLPQDHRVPLRPNRSFDGRRHRADDGHLRMCGILETMLFTIILRVKLACASCIVKVIHDLGHCLSAQSKYASSRNWYSPSHVPHRSAKLLDVSSNDF